MKIKKIFYIFNMCRPYTLLLSTSSIVLPTLYAFYKDIYVNKYIFLFSVFMIILIQSICNIANDYGDFLNHFDSNINRPDKFLCNGKLSVDTIGILILCMIILFLILSFIFLYIILFNNFIVFKYYFFINLLSIYFALKYSLGSNSINCIPFISDILVVIFFGIIPVNSMYYLYSYCFDVNLFKASIIIGLFSLSIFNLNNIRDLIFDEKNHKITSVVFLGLKKSKIYYSVIVLLPFILTCLIKFDFIYNFYFLILFFFYFFHLKKIFFQTNINFNFELKKNCVIIFLYTLVLGYYII